MTAKRVTCQRSNAACATPLECAMQGRCVFVVPKSVQQGWPYGHKTYYSGLPDVGGYTEHITLADRPNATIMLALELMGIFDL